jgi:membrane protease YdiL (CAAX protease family)
MIGSVFVMLLTKLLGIELSKVQKGLVAFLITTILSLALFPKVFKIPFGKQTIVEWLSNLGIYFPQKFTHHILLGVLLGVISLSGMLIASLITGKYEFNLSNLSPGHFIFCLTPGIWEEIFFRGVIMIVLISIFKNLRKAFWWQVFIFAACHFQSISITGGIEIVSVFIIGITFTLLAVKTRCLIAGIIYHYIHDAFLYLVQNPGGKYHGFEDQFTFYIFLWSAMLINIIIINLASDVLKIKGNKRIYAIDAIDDNFTLFQPKKNLNITSRLAKIILLIFAMVSLLSFIDNIHNGLNLFNSLSLFCFLLNLSLFILSFKKMNIFFYLVFLFNGINSFILGYQTSVSGSQRAYLILYLTGVIYIVITIYFLSMTRQKIKNTG